MSFDPPVPPKEPATRSVGRVALIMASLPLVYVLWVLLVPVRIAAQIYALATGQAPRERQFPAPKVPPDLAETSAPRIDAGGLATCTGCGAHVPFGSMSLDERGYFCARCAATR